MTNRGSCGRVAIAWVVMMMGVPAARAEPGPGDVFREYRWTPTGGDAGGALRVGGKKGAHDPGRGSDTGYINDPVAVPHALDLDGAVRAEVVIEKLLCHDGTRGLAIAVNGHKWLAVPEAPGIPEPQWDYQHHTFPVVDVPLGHLVAGAGNRFRLRVSPEHPWDWPQNLIYGVHIRIYYDAAAKAAPSGGIVRVKRGDAVGRLVPLEVEAPGGDASIARVDFVGRYEDVNLEGDGLYRRWHYRYDRAALAGVIGSATQAPWRVDWNTSWVPDQPEPMELAAWITGTNGLTRITQSIGDVRLDRQGLQVELCRPQDVPRQWVTREEEKEQRFTIAGDPKTAVAARLVFSSWSPGYLNGIDINGHRVFGAEGGKYRPGIHRIPLADLGVLKRGGNTLRTGVTPRDAKGAMVHGAEINWPGVMVLIQYGGERPAWVHLSSMTGGVPVPDLGRQTAAVIFDGDKDGVNDFMVASYEKIAWFRRSGGGWTRHMIENGDPAVRTEAGGVACDVDGDGDSDIIMGAQSKRGEIWWWENPHPNHKPDAGWKRRTAIEAGGTHHDQVAADFDGDGRVELAFWYNAGGLLYLAEIPRDPTGPWPHEVIWTCPQAGAKPEGLAAVDLDGDGRPDIVGGGSWFRNTGGRFEVHDIDSSYRFSRTAVGDFIKGGWKEVLIGSGDGIGPLCLYEHRADRWEKRILINPVDHGHTLCTGDIDGDGHLDIYTGEMKNPGAGDRCRQWVLFGDGRGGFTTQLLSTGIGTHEGKLGDLDGDGDLDILQKDFQADRRVDVWISRLRAPP